MFTGNAKSLLIHGNPLLSRSDKTYPNKTLESAHECPKTVPHWPRTSCRTALTRLRSSMEAGARMQMWSLRRLKMRYRRPYAARHTSVSWNLMIDRNALLVTKEHGHRPLTMLTIYAAWTEGAPEHDIRAIRAARNPKEGKTIRHAEATTAPVKDAIPINSSAAARRLTTRTSRASDAPSRANKDSRRWGHLALDSALARTADRASP
jgi:hypothetical protein